MAGLWDDLMASRMPQEAFDPRVVLPQISIENREYGRSPAVGGSLSAPLFGGQVGIEGSYLKPDQFTPPEWSAMMRYKRQF